MIKFFSSSHTITLIALPLVAIVLVLLSFAEPFNIETFNSMILFEIVDKYANKFVLISTAIGLFLVVYQAIIINNIVSNHEILKNNYIAAFIYIMLTCSSRSFISVNPVLISNLFVLLSLNAIFSLYEESNDNNIFNASFFISIASLFYLPAALIIPLVFISLIILRSITLRELAIAFSGFMIPYVFYFTYYFWYDKVGFVVDKHFYSLLTNKYNFEIKNNYFVFAIIAGIILLMAFLKINSPLKESLQQKKFRTIIVWMFFLLVSSFLFLTNKSTNHIILVFIPVSIIISKYFFNIKKKWLAEVLLWIMILGIMISKV